MLSRLLALVITIAAVPGACWQEQVVVGPLTVWNRTAAEIEISSGDRTEFVPACAIGEWKDFTLRPQFEIKTSSGTGATLAADTGTTEVPEAFFAVVTNKGAIYASVKPPATLPPCET